jgi:predicted alpha/beta-fold hydrolase
MQLRNGSFRSATKTGTDAGPTLSNRSKLEYENSEPQSQGFGTADLTVLPTRLVRKGWTATSKELEKRMPELIINGPAGRIEARYHHDAVHDSPVALILHPHPQFGGTMNNQVVYTLYHTFAERGFSVLRFNFRGVGRSQGIWDGGPGELSDAASALDWLQLIKPDAKSCWIAGVSFGT